MASFSPLRNPRLNASYGGCELPGIVRVVVNACTRGGAGQSGVIVDADPSGANVTRGPLSFSTRD